MSVAKLQEFGLFFQNLYLFISIFFTQHQMKDEYDDFDENEDFQRMGLGSRKRPMSKNQQIYGDFYQAYQQEPKMNFKSNMFSKSAYSNFKSGSTIENYAEQCDVHIPEQKPKKKVKTEIIEQEEQQGPVIGQFNLQSFLKEYQQNQELQQIEEQSQQQEFTGPFCLHSKVKTTLGLVKIGEEDDQFDGQGNVDLSEMTFEQYQKLAMRNGKKGQDSKKKKLTPEEREKEKEFIQGYGVGYKMLEKMGFNVSKGLGKEQKGMTRPVEAVFKTAFTTKDSQLRQQQQSKDQQQETQEDEMPAQQALFQYRSRNTKVNNFLLDLKNKFQSVTSKMFFYQRQVQNYDRDDEITNSLKLQKLNQISQHQEEIKKLTAVKDYGIEKHQNFTNIDHKQELNLRNIYPRLALKYKLDVLFVKNHLLKLKSMKQFQLYEKFPDVVKQMNRFLNNFYLQKERQSIKGYQQGVMSFKDKDSKIWNVNEEVIDLVDQGPTEEESVATVSIEDQQKIIRMIELVAEKTIIQKINQVLATYRQISDIKNFKMLECLRTLKQLNKTSQIVHNIISTKIKPLVFKYYETFSFEEVIITIDKKKDQTSSQLSGQTLPHLVLFPLFQIMDPGQMQFGRFLTKLSQKLWNLKSITLYNILHPIMQYCPSKQREHFVNFYLSPRLLYQLQEFDLSQAHICKQLISSLKSYKQFLPSNTIFQLIDSTIVPEIVMTYKKYQNQGASREDLLVWVRRWCKQIGKIAPQHLEQVLVNDFNIHV